MTPGRRTLQFSISNNTNIVTSNINTEMCIVVTVFHNWLHQVCCYIHDSVHVVTYMTVCCYIHDSMLLHTWQCVVTYMTVCCYIHDSVLLHTWKCVVTYMTVCCYIHDSVLLHTWQCVVIYMTVCCYIHESVLLHTWQCVVTYVTVYCYICNQAGQMSHTKQPVKHLVGQSTTSLNAYTMKRTTKNGHYFKWDNSKSSYCVGNIPLSLFHLFMSG